MQRYEPLGGRRQALLVALGVLIAVDVLAVGSSLLELDLLDRLDAGEPVTDAELTNSQDRQSVFGGVQFALYALCAILFIRWLRAAYRNTDFLRPGLRRYHHGWAIGAWFVPILYLWRPKQVVNDVWRAGGTDKLSPLLTLWWAGWILVLFLGWIAAQAGWDVDTIEQMRTADTVYVASDALDAAVALLAVLVVRRITERLDGSAAAVAPGGDPPAPTWRVDPYAPTSALQSAPPPAA